MTSPARTTGLLASLVLGSTALTGMLAGTAGAAGYGTAASMAPKILTADVVHGLASLEAHYRATPTPAATVLHLGVMVGDPDPAAVTAYGDSVNIKGSPDYRRFLTAAEFNARFGPTDATIGAVTAWLRSGGLTVYSHADSPSYLTATGTAGQVSSLMHTSFVTFASRGFLANIKGPTVPGAVLGVAGLNTGVVPRVPDPIIRRSRADSPPIGLVSPKDLWDIYQQPGNDTGQGQSMALFGLGTVDFGGGDSIESYLRQFEDEYSLPHIAYSVKYFQSDPSDVPTDTSGEEEWVLDAQAADGMAPGADSLVDYFGAGLTDADAIGSYLEWADDPNGPLQGSTSYGGCEAVPDTQPVLSAPGADDLTYLGNPNQDMYEQVFAQLVDEGRTLFSASGDTGQGCGLITDLNGVTIDPDPVQNYPGISPNVVGVGGSVLYFNGESTGTPATRITEYPWPYSSGGRSYFEPANIWQAAADQPVSPAGTSAGSGLPADPYTNYVDADGNPATSGFPARLQPDVAALSGDAISSGYTICDSSGCDQSAAGTSLASPLWLGMWSRVQALEPANTQGDYVGLGFAEATIYRLAQPATYLKAFYDLGNAMESPPSVPTDNLSDAPLEGGYDTQTGWGVLNVESFATLATGSTTFDPVNPSGQSGAPPADLPESPLPVALPVLALAATAGGVLVRRRRVLPRTG